VLVILVFGYHDERGEFGGVLALLLRLRDLASEPGVVSYSQCAKDEKVPRCRTRRGAARLARRARKIDPNVLGEVEQASKIIGG
jgi:hypothetical protein